MSTAFENMCSVVLCTPLCDQSYFVMNMKSDTKESRLAFWSFVLLQTTVNVNIESILVILIEKHFW